MKPDYLELYLVTDRRNLSDDEFLVRVDQACAAGVTLVQLREKEVTTAEFYSLALKVKAITERYNIPLIINDRVDICLAVDAAGIHIGDDELPVWKARELIGPDKLLGVSAKSVERSVVAYSEGADYLGVGAIYPTQTKNSALVPMDELDAILDQIDLPVVAIGGINTTNIESFSGMGLSGVAIVSEIMYADNIAEKVKDLKSRLKKMREEECNECQ